MTETTTPQATTPGGFSVLRRFVQRTVPDEEAPEACDFCAEVIGPIHRHLLAVASREIFCVCQACSILFDQRAASKGKYCLIPDRRLYLADFRMDETAWAGLHIPVEMAFFFYSTPAARVMAYYPSAMGPAESLLPEAAWQAMVARNPLLADLAPDVETLLVNHLPQAGEGGAYFVAPIDECYRLVALLRTHWRGLSGGGQVWQEIDRFFATLKERATVRRDP